MKDLPTIGQNIKDHIEEFLETGKVQEFLEYETQDKGEELSKDDLEDFMNTLRKTCESSLPDLKDNLRIDPLGDSRKTQGIKELNLRMMRKDGEKAD